ncbi:MAG: hypothetical protein SWH78_02665 [Thermodesulfobacteriota bacterium]|nr:hypothetical protein [Thermodesulfobacteriota bacterium]
MTSKRSLLLLAGFLAVFITMIGAAKAEEGFQIDSVVVTDAYGNEMDEFEVYNPVMIKVNYTVDDGIAPCCVKVIVKGFDQRRVNKLTLDSAGSDTITEALNPTRSGEANIKCILKVFKDGVLLGNKDKVVKHVTIIGLHGPACWGLEESECRSCHGNNLANRHHLTDTVLRDHLCTVCHPTCTPGIPNCPNGVLLIRDCLTSGCHTPID